MQDQKDEIRYLHKLLQYYDKWYIEINCPDVAMLQEIADKAKTRADKVLTRVTVNDLWTAYLKWDKSDKIMQPNDNPYFAFLNDFVWEEGFKYLKGTEKTLYGDSINLSFKLMP
jgi:hypothetical protein